MLQFGPPCRPALRGGNGNAGTATGTARRGARPSRLAPSPSRCSCSRPSSIVGFIGFAGAVSAYAYFAQGLDEPKQVLDEPDLQPAVEGLGPQRRRRAREARRRSPRGRRRSSRSRPSSSTRRPRSRTRPSGRTRASTRSASPPPPSTRINGDERGGSTITQQLVRARLLPQAAFDGSVYERKVKEIIQSIRLTQAYPGDDGKQKIMAAYLNQNFYGNAATVCRRPPRRTSARRSRT